MTDALRDECRPRADCIINNWWWENFDGWFAYRGQQQQQDPLPMQNTDTAPNAPNARRNTMRISRERLYSRSLGSRGARGSRLEALEES